MVHIQILYGRSLLIYDDLINFWKELIKIIWLTEEIKKKMAVQ